MYRIRLHGRGGQGIKMASRVLGTALFHAGFRVQDAPKYGAERRGAPIFATVRAARDAARHSIDERGVVHNPDLVVVADDTLIAVPAAGVLQGVGPDTTLLVNTRDSAETWSRRLNTPARLLVLPAAGDAEDRANLAHIGATCAGAAARLLGVISKDDLTHAIEQEMRHLGEETVQRNLASTLTAFDALAGSEGLVTEGSPASAESYVPPAWVDLGVDDAGLAAPAVHAVANSVMVRTGLWRTLRPVIDYERCRGCWWVCSTLCPDSAISVTDDAPVIDYDHCKGCMICVGVCPPHAIDSVPEYLAQQAEAAGGETA
jgi:pyruvate ferredoxin oxidoreductase gamma subunit